MKTKYQILPRHGVISKPGHYYLENNFISKDMFAIKIEANDVTLDLNNNGVYTEMPDRAKTTFGVYALECSNVHVFNGQIHGSSIGVHAAYSNKFKASLLDINGCTHIGMNIGGANAIVTNCVIENIGGHTEEAYAIGINSSDANHALMSFNRIQNIYRQNVSKDCIGEGVAILLGHDSCHSTVASNTIINNLYQENTYSLWAVGIDHSILNNIFCNSQFGVYMGKSELSHNIIMLKNKQPNSFAVSGGMGTCFGNDIINYEQDYNYNLQEQVTEQVPFITD